jgi:hypothetical protein
MTDDLWFEGLVDASSDATTEQAPPRLKSSVYSALVANMAAAGPLLGLKETKQAGGELCVFEHLVAVLPVGPRMHSMNPCRICHARVMGERMTHAPIFWPGCPYAEFHNG